MAVVRAIWYHSPLKFFLFALLLTAGSWRAAGVLTTVLVIRELCHMLAHYYFKVGVKDYRFGIFNTIITPAKPFDNQYQVGFTGLAGAMGGLAQGTLALAYYHFLSPQPKSAFLVAIIAAINLLSCTPVLMADGASVWFAITSRLKNKTLISLTAVVGVAMLGVLVLFKLYAMAILIVILIGSAIYAEWLKAKHDPADDNPDPEPAPITKPQIVKLGLAYLATTTALGLLTWYAFHLPTFSWDAFA